jgi:pantetheine-phosphate adenylyltransferase
LTHQALDVHIEAGVWIVASHRKEKGFPALEVFTIDVISSDSSKVPHQSAEELRNLKLSSTFIREWLVSKGRKKNK